MMSLSQAAQFVDGTLQGGDAVFTAVSTDTRSLQQGALYFALKGDRFDGHKFVADAGAAGAVGAVVEDYIEVGLPQIKVGDTRQALIDLAASWRQSFKGSVVGITGSNGKTTVKEMVAAILSKCGSVLATQGNLNNDIGVPLTLLRMTNTEDFAVIEMGANHKSEIDLLTHIAQPHVAIITNAGPAHLEGFGSLQGVAEAKAEIYSGLTESGVAVINADDQFAGLWESKCSGKKIMRFGLDAKDADVKGEWKSEVSGSLVKVMTRDKQYCEIHLPVPGRHNAMNALAAIAASLAVGATLQDAQSALSEFRPVKGRLNIMQLAQGVRVIDDTYNANPASLDAGLKVLNEFDGLHWLVLGDMGELGGDAAQYHFDIGQAAKLSGIDCLLATGENTRQAVKGF
ncbi:MAG: UDP-N-acetylmuramoyl-tripeptide--D-alanyl-D-alanine ligase, partial [Gammaproteobacteria bacterium]|nr:UDP-N-acetylmuramoyl-tripeptide--D-alanyl-D-alanine ligase [Gammaproteobacteria bacterium]